MSLSEILLGVSEGAITFAILLPVGAVIAWILWYLTMRLGPGPPPLMTRKRHWEFIADVLWSLKDEPGIDQSTLKMIAWHFAARLQMERYLKGGTGFDYERFIADATARPTQSVPKEFAKVVQDRR